VENQIYVWNLESPGSWRTKTVTGGVISSTDKLGAGYNSANRKIVLGGPKDNGDSQYATTVLRTIAIPVDLWNASSPLTMSSLPLTGTLQAITPTFRGTFSGGRLIDDMGNGQSLFVCHTRATSQPTQVVKLPTVF
jgi:hypothetical protein